MKLISSAMILICILGNMSCGKSIEHHNEIEVKYKINSYSYKRGESYNGEYYTIENQIVIEKDCKTDSIFGSMYLCKQYLGNSYIIVLSPCDRTRFDVGSVVFLFPIQEFYNKKKILDVGDTIFGPSVSNFTGVEFDTLLYMVPRILTED